MTSKILRTVFVAGVAVAALSVAACTKKPADDSANTAANAPVADANAPMANAPADANAPAANAPAAAGAMTANAPAS